MKQGIYASRDKEEKGEVFSPNLLPWIRGAIMTVRISTEGTQVGAGLRRSVTIVTFSSVQIS